MGGREGGKGSEKTERGRREQIGREGERDGMR